MPLAKSFIPYGHYWSSPFCRWQGSFSRENSYELAAKTTQKFFEKNNLTPDLFDSLTLGTTVPQHKAFWAAPWLAGLSGLGHVTGPIIGQACATSVRIMANASMELETGLSDTSMVVACDRVSNGPHVYFPDPKGVGGMGITENPVLDNFNLDPYAKNPMVQTAENVAKEAGITTDMQNEITLQRHQQYDMALANDREFQKRYMMEIEIGRGKKAQTIDSDEGVFPTTSEGLAKLQPVVEGGTVTYGSQTHPADGNAGMVVCSQGKAAELSQDGPVIHVLGFGSARVEKGFMPKAILPATKKALQHAGIELNDLSRVKSHNPFAVNDVYFCQQTNWDQSKLNNYGCALIYGHPQGPTGLRGVIELIEELTIIGGGYGLFVGCAAGDTAMATVIKVG